MWNGEIWWADLNLPRGSEPGKRRPVLIVQSDSFNRSRINTRIVVVITSNMKLADAPGNVKITAKQSQLPKDSVINVSQLLTLDKLYLTKKIGDLPVNKMQQVEAGLKLVMELT